MDLNELELKKLELLSQQGKNIELQALLQASNMSSQASNIASVLQRTGPPPSMQPQYQQQHHQQQLAGAVPIAFCPHTGRPLFNLPPGYAMEQRRMEYMFQTPLPSNGMNGAGAIGAGPSSAPDGDHPQPTNSAGAVPIAFCPHTGRPLFNLPPGYTVEQKRMEYMMFETPLPSNGMNGAGAIGAGPFSAQDGDHPQPSNSVQPTPVVSHAVDANSNGENDDGKKSEEKPENLRERLQKLNVDRDRAASLTRLAKGFPFSRNVRYASGSRSLSPFSVLSDSSGRIRGGGGGTNQKIDSKSADDGKKKKKKEKRRDTPDPKADEKKGGKKNTPKKKETKGKNEPKKVLTKKKETAPEKQKVTDRDVAAPKQAPPPDQPGRMMTRGALKAADAAAKATAVTKVPEVEKEKKVENRGGSRPNAGKHPKKSFGGKKKSKKAKKPLLNTKTVSGSDEGSDQTEGLYQDDESKESKKKTDQTKKKK